MLCSHSQICSGCPLIQSPIEEQKRLKQEEFSSLWLKSFNSPSPPLQWIDCGEGGLRDRVDLTLEEGRLGFYSQSKKSIFDLQNCPQMSPTLQEWFTEFKKISWPIKKGSLRLRVSPFGERGVWLDFANIDIKSLLEEQDLLKKLLQKAVVEVGQKRKRLQLVNNQLKLRDPDPQIWTRTFANNKEIPLYSCIGSFSQPGDISNQKIVGLIEKLIQKTASQNIIEFGAGHGNLSFPAVSQASSLTACEVDPLALEGFKMTLEKSPEFKEKIQLYQGDFQRTNPLSLQSYDLLLLNPPRSGLGDFLKSLEQLEKEKMPQYLLYMSCYLESFLKDMAQASTKNYQIQEIYGLDQFPQTAHFEIISLWTLKD